MNIIASLPLRVVFDVYFTPSPTPEKKPSVGVSHIDGLFSCENPRCLRILLSQLGYLFTEEEMHLSLQTMFENAPRKCKIRTRNLEDASQKAKAFDEKFFCPSTLIVWD